MKKIVVLLIAASTLVFTGCVKSGPPGPQGPTGATGPTGNANVIGSNPFTVSSWTYGSSDVAYYASFAVPDITADIYNFGSVQVFIKYSDGTWRNLPDILNGTMFTFGFYTGGFDILFSNVNGSIPDFPGTQTFRTIIISSALKQANPKTDWKDYKQAMAAIEAANSTPASAK